ncbi:hypothetical protein HJG60_010956 [Phyllostomus discolor]|uniref:Uncharacterized protein n=1 Tax=Phyllostomus discolor TaxID=89673 RepID=A0A834AEY3_9CHIR|nr:hypothetical protein HJG60_010956 [Phyllostomus discolor]
MRKPANTGELRLGAGLQGKSAGTGGPETLGPRWAGPSQPRVLLLPCLRPEQARYLTPAVLPSVFRLDPPYYTYMPFSPPEPAGPRPALIWAQPRPASLGASFWSGKKQLLQSLFRRDGFSN